MSEPSEVREIVGVRFFAGVGGSRCSVSLDGIEVAVNRALDAARAEGKAEGVQMALEVVANIDGPLLPHERRSEAKKPSEDTQGVRADGVNVARYAIEELLSAAIRARGDA